MKSKHTFSLASGTYASEDARELLTALVTRTSRFHTIKNLRSWETQGTGDEQSEKRIEELHNIRDSVLKMLGDVVEKDLSLEIKAEINISTKKG